MNYPHLDFEKASCKEANIEKGLLVDLFDRIRDDRLDIHSLVLVKDGNKVFDAYASGFGPGITENVYSISKSFTSVAIGVLRDRGLVGIDDPVLRYFPEVGVRQPAHERLTVRHLLTMSAGHDADFFGGLVTAADPIAYYFTLPVATEPGTAFYYDNTATFLLSAIITRITGMKTVDFLDDILWKRLFIAKPEWDEHAGYTLGATGLHLDAIALAKFGHLLLNEGVWAGERVVSAEYLREATSSQIVTADAGTPVDRYGYGFQFWMNAFGDYRCAGMYKQYVVIDRHHGAVFVVQAYEQRETLDLFSTYVLPAMQKGWLFDNYTLRTYIQRFHDDSRPLVEEERKTRTVW